MEPDPTVRPVDKFQTLCSVFCLLLKPHVSALQDVPDALISTTSAYGLEDFVADVESSVLARLPCICCIIHIQHLVEAFCDKGAPPF